MINKIAESHFNTLRITSSIAIQTMEGKSIASSVKHDAFETFISTPSFSNKKMAIESLIQQITRGNNHYGGKTGVTG